MKPIHKKENRRVRLVLYAIMGLLAGGAFATMIWVIPALDDGKFDVMVIIWSEIAASVVMFACFIGVTRIFPDQYELDIDYMYDLLETIGEEKITFEVSAYRQDNKVHLELPGDVKCSSKSWRSMSGNSYLQRSLLSSLAKLQEKRE